MNDTHDELNLPARELAALIREKKVSPVEVVEAALRRIEANKHFNAFITVTADAAMEAAKVAEQQVMAGAPLGPLHGVPYSVKDLTLTAGVRTTMGSAIFADFVPQEDAVAVARSKAAGAILLGKTTTPEFGAKQSTDAPIFGRTLNPINPAFTCGASSGGAAVAVATGMGAIALGSDGGGSIRIPASCCGIVGLKATLGDIANLQPADLFSANSYVGPMARDVADTRLFYSVLNGPHARDPWGLSLSRLAQQGGAGQLSRAQQLSRLGQPSMAQQLSGTGQPNQMQRQDGTGQPSMSQQQSNTDALFSGLDAAALKGLRVAYMPTCGNRVHHEVKAATDAVARALEQAGAIVEEVSLDFVALEQHFLVILESMTAARVQPHLARFRDQLDPALVALTERGLKHTAVALHEAAFARTRCFQDMQKLFEHYDVLLSPTVSAPPLSIDQDPNGIVIIDGEPAGTIRGAWYPYTYPMNLTGHPALSMPCGTSSNGLPIGLQLCGKWYSEAFLLDLAEQVDGLVQQIG